jgi:hypothetical protein
MVAGAEQIEPRPVTLHSAGLSLEDTGGVPVFADQARTTSLAELAKRFRKAQVDFLRAASNTILHAINAGQALIAAKELTPHGQWGKFLASCNVGDRQAERYMRLAGLAAANPTCKSDLAGLTIEAAIKKLSPPKPPTTTKRPRGTKPFAAPKVAARTTHIDVIAAWMATTPTEHTKAIDAIGLEPLLAAIPGGWWPLLEAHIASRGHASATIVPAPAAENNDLSLPEFLRRQPPNSADVIRTDPTTHSCIADVRRGMALEIGERQ